MGNFGIFLKLACLNTNFIDFVFDNLAHVYTYNSKHSYLYLRLSQFFSSKTYNMNKSIMHFYHIRAIPPNRLQIANWVSLSCTQQFNITNIQLSC